VIKKINAVKNNFNAGKKLVTQTSGANSEHKRSEIEHFSMLNEHIISYVLFHHTIVKTQNSPSLSTVSKFSDLH